MQVTEYKDTHCSYSTSKEEKEKIPISLCFINREADRLVELFLIYAFLASSTCTDQYVRTYILGAQIWAAEKINGSCVCGGSICQIDLLSMYSVLL